MHEPCQWCYEKAMILSGDTRSAGEGQGMDHRALIDRLTDCPVGTKLYKETHSATEGRDAAGVPPLDRRILQDQEEEIRKLRDAVLQWRSERAHWLASYQKAVNVLTGIYGLLNPPETIVGDKKYRFENPHANDTLQALSDAIRAIPAELRTQTALEPRRRALPLVARALVRRHRRGDGQAQ
jgi:hypothetical protein